MKYIETAKFVFAGAISATLVCLVDTEKLPAPVKAFVETFSTIKAQSIKA